MVLSLHDTTGQTWAPTGANWYYHYSDPIIPPSFAYAYIYHEVVKDSVIQGKLCSEIVRVIYHWDGSKEILPDNIFTYESSDTVYYLQNNIFYPLYIFSVEAGDSWVSRNPYELYYIEPYPDEDTLTTYYVDSVDYIEIDGQNLKRIWLNYYSSDWYFAGPIIEKIGCLHYFLPGFWHLWDPPVPASLRCYHEDAFNYEILVPCDSIIFLSIEEVKNNQLINIYPNPFENNLIIEAEYPIEDFIIYDMYGKRMNPAFFIKTNGKLELDFSNLNLGVYLITLNTNNTIRNFKILKK